MTAPAVGQLRPADVPVGTVLHLVGIGNNRRAPATTGEVVKVGRALVTVKVAYTPGGVGRTFDVVLRLDTQCENHDFAGWRFRTAEQAADDVRRSEALERLRKHGVAFVDPRRYTPSRDDEVPVDLAEVLAAAADEWAASR